MKKIRKICFLSLIGLFFTVASAFALYIDFTNSSIYGGLNAIKLNSATIVDPYGVGLDIYLDANPGTAWLTYNSGDGIGINESGPAGWEYDEIEWDEEFIVKFKDDGGNLLNYHLDKIYLTDLFYEHSYLEQGKYSLYSNSGWTAWTAFTADPGQVLGSTNGMLDILVGETVKGIKFGGVKNDGFGKYEYSVAGMKVNPVPEPATMLLVGVGLIGLAGLQRKIKIKKKAI